MLKITEKRNALNITISSETSLIRSVTRVARDYMAEDYSSHLADLEIVLRELIINAIDHGNHGVKERRVNISLKKLCAKGLEISVSDEGNGFNYNAVDLNLPAIINESKGRGLKLVNALAASVSYEKKSNRLTARLGTKGESFLVMSLLRLKTWQAA